MTSGLITWASKGCRLSASSTALVRGDVTTGQLCLLEDTRSPWCRARKGIEISFERGENPSPPVPPTRSAETQCGGAQEHSLCCPSHFKETPLGSRSTKNTLGYLVLNTRLFSCWLTPTCQPHPCNTYTGAEDKGANTPKSKGRFCHAMDVQTLLCCFRDRTDVTHSTLWSF